MPLNILTKIKSKIIDNVERIVLYKQIMEKYDIFNLQFDAGIEFTRPDGEWMSLNFLIYFDPSAVFVIAVHPEGDKEIATISIRVTDVGTNEVIIGKRT